MSDPFDGLEDWAKQAERRAKRADRRRRLRAVFRIRSSRARSVLFIASAVAAAVLLAAALPTIRTYLPGGSAYSADSSADSPLYPTQAVPSGVSATTTASAAPTDPFEGTPAATYPKGEAGITLPPATAVTGFTAAQVDAALQQVRKALVAARLDQQMLVGHDPAALLALLAPNSAKGIKTWFDGTEFSALATWIDPAAHLDPAEEVRVSGRITFDSAEVDGIQTLRITTNFVWVYAFTGNGRNPLAAEHDETRWDFPATGRLRAADKGMWVGAVKGYMAWIDCAAAGKGLLAPYRSGAGAQPGPTEDPDAYLKADHSLTIADDCDPAASSAPAVAA
ncbi:hypothetical protein AB0K00_24610 [Dactylosporangium sp. NPDC049525]|uniref:hypothetical protein n=1 Tax=Dactylosporangium sp. NPDC049525 TaxID=3154730 RepID=UPI00341B5FB6